jgi:predicted GNAT family acetyltransferase
MEISVHHEAGRGSFSVRDGSAESVLEYVRGGPGLVTFVHTFVPPDLRGRGLAERLVTAGLSWAREQGLRVTATCSYVAAYLDRHPEWDDLRAEAPSP